MKLNRAHVIVSIFALLCAARAQQSAIQQFQNSQQQQLQMPQPELRVGTNAPELYTGENEDIGPQRILRLNQAAPVSRRTYFDALFDSQIFYSDNANYGQANSRIGSWVFMDTVQAAFLPPTMDLGPGKFAPAVGFYSQWYNYSSGRMKPLDFDAQTAFINLRYLLGNWQIALGANYTRLLNQNGYNETYREGLPSLTVQRVFPIGEKMAFVVGDAVDYHWTHIPQGTAARTDINDHFDNTFYATFNWQITSHFLLQPSYRFQYSDYKNDTFANGNRNDYLSCAGITLFYTFNQNISARAFFNYNTKTSDDQFTPSYDELNEGIGATLDIKF